MSRGKLQYNQAKVAWAYMLVGVVASLLLDYAQGQDNKIEAISITPYLYLQMTEEAMGGEPAKVTAVYFDSKGYSQLTTETSDDKLVTATFGTVLTNHFETLFRQANQLGAAKSMISGRTSGDPLPEFTSAQVYLELRSDTGEARSFQWSAAEMLPVTRNFVHEAQALASKPLVSIPASSSRYIRSSILAAGAIDDLRRAKLLREIALDTLKKEPLLQESLTHPMKLVSVPEETNPYAYCNGSFRAGWSVHILCNQICWQVRNLVKN